MAYYTVVQVFFTLLSLKPSRTHGTFRCSLNQQEKVHVCTRESVMIERRVWTPPGRGGCVGQGPCMAFKLEVNIN